MGKMIWGCMLLILIVVGIVYYYHETQKEPISERGVLIVSEDMGWRRLWQE